MSRAAEDRTGLSVGKLTVIGDNGAAEIRCRCSCGREGMHPRAIFKPSYRGPTACRWCLGSPCDECGTVIPRQAGRQPATCSSACQSKRKLRREKERYHRIKGTEHFKRVREAYLSRLAQAMSEDSELAACITHARRTTVRRWRQRQMADPILREQYLERHRESEARRMERIRSESEKYAEHLRKQREWYRSLSDEDYQRIYVEPRQRK